jgi:hypothetical protein
MRHSTFILLLAIVLFPDHDANAQGFGGGVFVGISTSQVTGDNIGGFNKVGVLGRWFYRLSVLAQIDLATGDHLHHER